MPSFSILRRTPRRRNTECAKPADATVITVTEGVFGGTGDAVVVAEGLGWGAGRGGGHGGGGRSGGLGLGLTSNNSDKTNNNDNNNNNNNININNNASNITFSSNESSQRNSIDENDNNGPGSTSMPTTTNEKKKKERRGSRRDIFLQDIRSRLTGKLPPSSSSNNSSNNNTSSPSSGASTPHQEAITSPKLPLPRGRAASQPPIPISQRRREYMSGREGAAAADQRGEPRGERQHGMGTIREAHKSEVSHG
ncbi:hypothetical protein GE21DRAFT_223 [Neurospora crassa]|uniref:Uncharacterized protein n=1 Tax=Neurospora crassa (strain ATCC 24698 / 74-OR23-1A / CBS 708.71 / DSM 1257 / FGSC 987) TaxID=367110 RepID=Q7SFQ4_NEUCR|nr:hypothetical protein NCU09096 [Neurospora crassa OR74A]EAA35677.1 hypothetical protein NCU09096 [Neurospora crassa OR74A]KHE82464.1 hypothetical protein GE21DRAFT_223 [Neurospora crassa]|eukprot:XP_964913.1 hypothetical protein NCU09096 [Neurospora crassa OR74A]